VQSEREVVHMVTCAMLSAWIPKDDCGVNVNVYAVQFNGFMSFIR
jgi:hypothetical protein